MIFQRKVIQKRTLYRERFICSESPFTGFIAAGIAGKMQFVRSFGKVINKEWKDSLVWPEYTFLGDINQMGGNQQMHVRFAWLAVVNE